MAGRLGRRSPGKDLPLGHAVALGLVQGPAELLPVSSSGHIVLVPAILGWPYGRLDPAERKAFEVMLHVGAAGGLALTLAGRRGDLDVRRLAELGLATAPAALCGFFLHDAIAGRLSAPRGVARAQVWAGTALAMADLRRADRSSPSVGDALAVGVAQAVALAPGVSRSGAALTALRLRRLDRRSAGREARRTAVPIIVGAGLLEAARLARRPPERGLAPAFLAGAAAAFTSTVASARLATAIDRAPSYAPLAAYRIALGALALRRLGRARRRHPAALRRAVEWRS